MTHEPKPKPTHVVPTARTVAADVLVRTWKDGAFASAVLDTELGRAVQLDPRDRALATELAYGALRMAPWIEEQLLKYAARGIDSLDLHVRAHLFLAAYQLFFLTRVPAFAAVNEAVDAVTRKNGPKVGAFANAVLRKLSRQAIDAPVDRREATLTSTAPWLKDALTRALGEEGARAFLEEGGDAPPTGIRVEEAKNRDAVLARLNATGAGSFEPGKVSPLAILASGAGSAQRLPGYAEGEISIQEEGSQQVALALGARPGEFVLDACAGRGNKTAILARAVQPGGAVDAADLHPSKLARLKDELSRLKLRPRETFAVDWSVGAGGIPAIYDAVLVDAPCSGTGTIRRRPEIQIRRTPENLSALSELQLGIVTRAASLVKPGGRLVYAVCSLLCEEAEEVVARLLEANTELVAAPFAGDALRALAGDATTFRLLPQLHGTEGYFLASFHRRA